MKTKQSLKPPTLRNKDDDALGYVMMLVGLFLTFFFLNVLVSTLGQNVRRSWYAVPQMLRSY